MTEVVTSATLLDEVRMARDAMRSASEWSRDAALAKPRAEIAYENAFAHAFTRCKDEGATDSLAKQKALIETTVERQKLYELKEELYVAKAELHAVGSLFEAYRSITWVVKEEMRLGEGFGGMP